MRPTLRLASLCAALLVLCLVLPRPAAAQSGAIGIRGDVNRDGAVTAGDALAVLSHVVGKTLPAAYTVELDGDADRSGEVTAVDALVILAHAVGKDVARYPVGRRLLSGLVRPAGGALVSRPDSVRLDLPDGALAEAAMVTVEPAAELPATQGLVAGTALVVGPEALRLAKPARLSLRVGPEALPQGVAPEALRLHRRVGGGWEPVPGGSVDAAAGVVSGEVAGPGTYAVLVGSGGGLRVLADRGDGQTGTVGRPPADFLVARVVDAAGRGVPGIEPAWTVTEGGGSVRAVDARTDSAGRARAVLTLGEAPGANRVRVSAPGAEPAVFTALGVADAPSAVTVVAGAGQAAVVGSAVATPPSVRVTDSGGNPVVDVEVAFAVASGGGSVTGAAPRTDADGVATVGSWTLGTAAGTNTLTAGVAAGPAATIAATGIPGPAVSIAIAEGDGGSAPVGSTRTLAARVTDAHGNGVPGETVEWAVAAGGGSLSAAASATDGAGVASTVWTLGTAVGAQGATATRAGIAGSPLAYAVAAVPGAPAQLALATQPADTAQSGIVLSRQPVVQLRDAFGNAVPQGGVAVTAAIASGGGALGGTATVVTDAAGAAAFTDLAISGTVGARTLELSATGLAGVTSDPVALAAGPPAALAFAAAPPGTARSGIALGQQPVLQLRDASGNDVAQAGVPVTAEIASGGGTLGGVAAVATDGAGRAAFADLAISGTVGPRTLAFSTPGLPAATSGTIDLAAGTPASLAITTQPSAAAQSGIALPVQPVLRLRDASGNDVAEAGVAVTAAIASGGGTLDGAATVATDAGGQAAFTDLAIGGTVGDRTLGFSSAGLADATSSVVSVGAGAPASLAVGAGDGQTAAAGAAVTVAPSVVVRDASGNPVSNVSVTFAVASGGGSVAGAEQATGADGTATAGSWTLGTVAGANTLTASATGLPAATFTATGVAGPAAAIAVQAGDGGTATVATARTLEARVTDTHGNPVQGHAVSWAVAAGGGSVGAPSSATDAAGVASAEWTLGTAAGAQSATATASGLAGSPLTFAVTATAAGASAASSTLTASPEDVAADGAAASTLTVQLHDAYGNPLTAGAGTVALSTTGGALSGVADHGDGSYTATLTAPTTVGTATVSGTLDGAALGTTATVSFVPGAAARYEVSASAAAVVAGEPVTVTARLVDAHGNAVPAAGRTVAWSSTDGGSFASPTSATDAGGVATVEFTTSTTAGATHTVTADDGAVSGTGGAVQTQAGAPAVITKSGADGVSLPAGSAVTPLPGVRVADAHGNGIAGVEVAFTVTSGGGSVTGASQTTDAAGVATVGSWTLGTVAGANTLGVVAGALSAGFTATGTVGPASAAGTQITTANPVLTAGSVTTVTVQVKDQYGNDVAAGGAAVTLSTSLGSLGPVTDAGNGAYTADLTHTGADGIATVTGTLDGAAIADDATVTFQSGGIQRTWTGLAGSNWNTAGSWSPRGTPTPQDTIVIDGGGTQPQVTDADKTILRLVMTTAGGTLDLGGFRLTVTGDAVATAGTVSNGTVQMSGSGRTLAGTFPGLVVTGSIVQNGSVTANGTVQVANGVLSVANQTLTIRGQ